MNKVDEQNESVPMDVDRVVVVKARGDMENHNNPVEVDNDLQDIMEIHKDPMEVTRICIQNDWLCNQWCTYEGLLTFA